MSWQYTNLKNSPKVFTQKAFFFLIDEKKNNFNDLIKNKKLHYKKYNKAKKDKTTFREIYRPSSRLKFVLKKINRKYLLKINLMPFIHCGPKGRSIVTACRRHGRFCKHLSLDIESFFDKVSKDVTEKALLKLGVNKNVIKLISAICVEDDRLPQGFPTSPLLSAIVINSVFDDFYSVFNSEKVIISFYADDILISSDDGVLNYSVENFIKDRLKGVGLTLNSKRIEGSKGTAFLWLGLNLYPKLSLPRKGISALQKKVYDYSVTGNIPNDFKSKNTTDTNGQWKKSIKGKLVFAESISKNKLIQKIANQLNKKEIPTKTHKNKL